MTKKRRRPVHLHVMVSEEEQALIREQMKTAVKQVEADRGQAAPKKNAPDRGDR